MKNTIIAIVVTLIIAGGAGYAYGKGSAGDTASGDKERADAIAMMKEQSASIKEMGQMMQTSGRNMQQFGAKYMDDMMVSEGKDLEMVGTKHMSADEKAIESNDSMNRMMD